MSYDADVMAAIAEELYEFHVEREHGALGIERLQAVLRSTKAMYLYRSPDSFKTGLTVFATLKPDEEVLDRGAAALLSSVDQVRDLGDGATIQVLESGQLLAWGVGVIETDELVGRSVVYLYGEATGQSETSEAIALPAGPKTVPNPNGYPSALAPPTFWNLDDSLTYYAARLARKSTCKILKQCWALDAKNRRLVFRNKPESGMRESLAQHLRSSLRDHKLVRVNEEQNVSESEPVDIQVTWSLTNQIALIEVKWLGVSLHLDGDKLGTSYSEARARSGAKQLGDYLLEFRERTPGHESKAYLVVFDGRRRGVTGWEPPDVTLADAYFYAGQEIDYEESVPADTDFQPPRRFFLEPRLVG